MEQFVAAWDGVFLQNSQEQFTVAVDLEKQKVPSVSSNGATIYRLGIGMVVFGRLAQNTESRVEIQLNNSITSTSVGAFQFSGVEFSRLHLEKCGSGGLVSMHLVIKAANITSVQSLRWSKDEGGGWKQPPTQGCNVTIDSDFVDIQVPTDLHQLSGATLYALLSRGGQVLTRVVARADGDSVTELCPEAVVIPPGRHQREYTIDVLQGNRVKYSGQEDFVQLTDVAALTLRVRSNSSVYRYSIDNISVVYSLVNASIILGLMPQGKVTPALEELCDSGNVCLIETLLESGVCATHEKCEVQGENGVFVMPLYPWGTETLKKNGTYTAMLTEIKETLVSQTTNSNTTSSLRRLMGWIGWR
jgi:hypothetical protein